VKKKTAIAVASMSSNEAFPTVGLALQLKVPTMVTSIPGTKVGEECYKSGLDGRVETVVASIHLEVVAVAMSKPSWLQETLPTTSRVLAPYEIPVT
jgi:hypothetical protein